MNIKDVKGSPKTLLAKLQACGVLTITSEIPKYITSNYLLIIQNSFKPIKKPIRFWGDELGDDDENNNLILSIFKMLHEKDIKLSILANNETKSDSGKYKKLKLYKRYYKPFIKCIDYEVIKNKHADEKQVHVFSNLVTDIQSFQEVSKKYNVNDLSIPETKDPVRIINVIENLNRRYLTAKPMAKSNSKKTNNMTAKLLSFYKKPSADLQSSETINPNLFELEQYAKIRQAEKTSRYGNNFNSFFAKRFAYKSATVKFSAVNKLICKLRGFNDIYFDANELKALTEGRLGKIVKKMDRKFLVTDDNMLATQISNVKHEINLLHCLHFSTEYEHKDHALAYYESIKDNPAKLKAAKPEAALNEIKTAAEKPFDNDEYTRDESYAMLKGFENDKREELDVLEAQQSYNNHANKTFSP